MQKHFNAGAYTLCCYCPKFAARNDRTTSKVEVYYVVEKSKVLETGLPKINRGLAAGARGRMCLVLNLIHSGKLVARYDEVICFVVWTRKHSRPFVH